MTRRIGPPGAPAGIDDGVDPVALREACVLPAIFLTVALAGGFRADAAGAIRLVPPPLVTMLLAMLLIGALLRARAIVPERLMSGRRNALANLSGIVVLLTLFAATAQIFNTLTPEEGLLHLLFGVFFVVLLWNTIVAEPDRPHLLRSLMVILGSALAIKYVMLAALYAPQPTLAKRVLTVLLEGATLGALTYLPDAPITGYVAFFAVALYLVGLLLLPNDQNAGLQAGVGRAAIRQSGDSSERVLDS
jgi:hypothetical protein